MTRIIDSAKTAVVWASVISTVFLTVIFTVFSLGPRVESNLFPVFGNVQAFAISIDRERQVLHLGAYAKKQRECEWKGINAMVYNKGQWQQGVIYFTDPRKNETPQTALPPSRPTGSQSLGEIFVSPAGGRVQVYLQHRCHPLWQTQTLLYELDFSKSPAQVQ